MAERKDPYGTYNFLVEIEGIARASFQEASGFDSSIEVEEHREGGENITTRKLPGMVKFSNIVLKWGLTDDHELDDWYQQWASGDPAAKRQSGSIVLLDRQGQEKKRWNFVNAWPTKLTWPSFNAENSDLAIMTLELAHEGLKAA
ncbi:phage tail protein [Lysobacter sp. CFH 32150]|uniref:phage tail protein n=1 Tax=Lysobacter sp. CFH 32150 TaxID=2927128 RepID=UPI001FA7B6BF|nr:phage tail protein [Lysobacter sp. CFH 32150]MCI4567340.1 phage tail protein [Lysobacter sp. CFH 32150]